jgi:hypothetical protein
MYKISGSFDYVARKYASYFAQDDGFEGDTKTKHSEYSYFATALTLQ